MARTKRTDTRDRDCAVKDCGRVEYRHGFCRTHYTELRTANGYAAAMVAQFEFAHRQAQRRERAMRKRAREQGLPLLSPSEQAATAPAARLENHV